MDKIVNMAHNHKGCIFIALVLMYIICAMNVPVSIYALAGHDDALFMHNAYRILNGEWLGTYTQMTLAKGPGFSFFIAANTIIGIPITLSIAIFYSFSCWILTNTLVRLGLPIILSFLVFALMLFHPEILPTRIIRDNVYPGLTLIALAAVIDIVFLQQRNPWMLFIYGTAIAIFWITREEGIWILPALGLMLIIKLFNLWFSNEKNEITKIIKPLVTLGFFIFLPIMIICTLNYWKYGAFLIVDFKEKNFSRSLSALNSIETQHKISHVPVNKEQRSIAYSVSPAFSELQNYFDNEGLHWTRPGCNNYKDSCGDYAGGWFMWAYRDAVFATGHYKSFGDASAFYQRVADDITQACKSKKIQCNSGSLGFLPKLNKAEISTIPSSFFSFYKRLTVQEKVHLDGGPSMDHDGVLQRMRLLLRNPLSVASKEENTLQVKGWYYHESNIKHWLTLECKGKPSKRVARNDSPDIAAFTKNPLANKHRFYFITSDPASCTLVSDTGEKISVQAISKQQSGPVSVKQDSTLYIDRAESSTPHQITKNAQLIKYGLASIYKFILPVLFWAGVISCLICTAFLIVKKQLPQPLFICALAAWALVFTRATILVLIDISSFPAINALYIGPAFPLVLLAAVLSIYSLYIRANSLFRRK